MKRGARAWVLATAIGAVFGTGLHRSVQAQTPGETGHWSPYVTISQPVLDTRLAYYDSLSDRVIVVGDREDDLPTLSLDGTLAWGRLAVVGPSPDKRSSSAGVVDPVERRFLVIGDTEPLHGFSHVWQLTLDGVPTWSEIQPAGESPPPLEWASAVYDASRDRVLLYGGEVTNEGGSSNDVWSLTLRPYASWTRLTTAGMVPPRRSHHAAVYDPVRDRMLIIAGRQPTAPRNPTDVWSLTLAGTPTWSLILTANDPPPLADWQVPSFGAVYDRNENRTIVVRSVPDIPAPAVEVYNLAMSGVMEWTSLATDAPRPATWLPAVVRDSRRHRVIAVEGGPAADETWALSLAGPVSWTRLVVSARVLARSDHQSILDPAGRRMIVFGGRIWGAAAFSNDLAQLFLEPPRGWMALPVPDPRPPARKRAAAVFDAARHRMILFGGEGPGVLNDLWTLELDGAEHWTPAVSSGQVPEPRSKHAMVYDPVEDRVLLFGGVNADGVPLRDLWALSLADLSWTALSPASLPPLARFGTSLIYDPIGDRVILFGGKLYTTNTSDTWELKLRPTLEWNRLSPTGSIPDPRHGHTAVYDARRARMLLFAGSTGILQDEPLQDTWELKLGSAPAWRALSYPEASLPARRVNHTAVYDSVADRMLVFGGVNGYDELMALSFGARAAPVVTCPGDVSAHPGDIVNVNYRVENREIGPATFDFTLASRDAWSGFPITGRTTVDSWGVGWVRVGIPVPISAAGEPNELTMEVVRRGSESSGDKCRHLLGNSPAPMLATFLSADASSDRVRLVWSATAGRSMSANVHRQDEDESWREVGAARREAADRLVFEDRQVTAGRRYRYRLNVRSETYEVVLADQEVRVPDLELALRGAAPNPASGAFLLSFTLSQRGPGRLEVFDLAGRGFVRYEIGSLAPGPHSMSIDGRGWPPGLYLVNLVQGAQRRSAKVCLLH
jgi:hypothetical protein